jgi:hypothetical protein
MTEADTAEIVYILESEYYSIGIESGHEALANLLDDFFNHRLDENFIEWGTSRHEFHETIFWFLAKKLFDEGKMWQSHHDFYSGKISFLID